uniref:Uncharacterized protein n=1 Tax=mine drainage metagenome TaxID=410659 RepID=E6Q8K6_9ZZZZ
MWNYALVEYNQGLPAGEVVRQDWRRSGGAAFRADITTERVNERGQSAHGDAMDQHHPQAGFPFGRVDVRRLLPAEKQGRRRFFTAGLKQGGVGMDRLHVFGGNLRQGSGAAFLGAFIKPLLVLRPCRRRVGGGENRGCLRGAGIFQETDGDQLYSELTVGDGFLQCLPEQVAVDAVGVGKHHHEWPRVTDGEARCLHGCRGDLSGGDLSGLGQILLRGRPGDILALIVHHRAEQEVAIGQHPEYPLLMLAVFGDDAGEFLGGARKDLHHMGLAVEVVLHQMLRGLEIRAGGAPGEQQRAEEQCAQSRPCGLSESYARLFTAAPIFRFHAPPRILQDEFH